MDTSLMTTRTIPQPWQMIYPTGQAAIGRTYPEGWGG